MQLSLEILVIVTGPISVMMMNDFSTRVGVTRVAFTLLLTTIFAALFLVVTTSVHSGSVNF